MLVGTEDCVERHVLFVSLSTIVRRMWTIISRFGNGSVEDTGSIQTGQSVSQFISAYSTSAICHVTP